MFVCHRFVKFKENQPIRQIKTRIVPLWERILGLTSFGGRHSLLSSLPQSLNSPLCLTMLPSSLPLPLPPLPPLISIWYYSYNPISLLHPRSHYCSSPTVPFFKLLSMITLVPILFFSFSFSSYLCLCSNNLPPFFSFILVSHLDKSLHVGWDVSENWRMRGRNRVKPIERGQRS